MKKNITSLAVAALLATPMAYADTLQKIKSSGEITLGHRDVSVPFSYLDDSKKPIGLAMDLCHKIVDEIQALPGMPKLKVNYKLVTPAQRIPLLVNNTIDIDCAQTTNNAERAKHVDYTPTFFVTTGRFVSKKAANISAVEDLKGKTAVAVAGTTDLKIISNLNREKNLGINVFTASNHTEAFLMVETDRAAAYFNDDILLAGLIATSKSPADFVISSQPLSVNPYGMMIRKNDTEFKKVVDQAVKKIFKNDFDQMYKTWLLQPLPSKNVNMNYPMQDRLKRILANPTDSSNPADY